MKEFTRDETNASIGRTGVEFWLGPAISLDPATLDWIQFGNWGVAAEEPGTAGL